MSTQPAGNVLTALSSAMANAVEQAGASTVLVAARPRLPATGIVYAPDLVLTADHVVEQDDDITVVLADGTELKASVAGRDPGHDLALLRLQSGSATPATVAAQDARVGELALALGRPSPDGIQASVGVVSAVGGPVRTGKGNTIERYLRTDTTPYPGFSGGPLINAAGEVLGLNTSGFGRGTSITIPASLAWQVASTLAQHGRVRRGYLGIRSQPVELPQTQQSALGRTQQSGLLLIWIEDGSPAAQAGLIVGDLIVGLGGQPVGDPDELQSAINGLAVGQQAQIEILRGGQPTTLDVTVGERK